MTIKCDRVGLGGGNLTNQSLRVQMPSEGGCQRMLKLRIDRRISREVGESSTLSTSNSGVTQKGVSSWNFHTFQPQR